MLNLKKVAVTGGLSSGKTTVCRFFKELGAYVVSADEIVHQLLSPETSAGQQVIKLIGSDILVEHKIDRSKIAQKVFGNQKLLQSLEGILHPAVRKEIETQFQKVQNAGDMPLFIAEVPLLFESDIGSYDFSIAVIADQNLSRLRFTKISGYGEEEYNKRMMRQLSPKEKAQKADFVIQNNGSLDELHQAVKKIYKQLIS